MSQPTTIYLVRHGQTLWNIEKRFQGHSDSPLTETGRNQAIGAGQKLADRPLSHAYASPSPRTMETARLVLGKRNLTITQEPRLREIYLGPLEGVTYDDALKSHPKAAKAFWERPHLFNVEGAENAQQVQTRVVESLGEIAKAHPGESLLVVSHGVAIKTALAWFMGHDISKLHEVALPENGSITTLTLSNGSWNVQR